MAKTISNKVKRASSKKVLAGAMSPEVITLEVGALCKSCVGGLNPITKSLCDVCKGTPQN